MRISNLIVLLTALDCPENTVYDPCFSGCPATCSSAGNTLSCNATCQETCRCEDGLVLDGGNCVDPSHCGCTLDNGVYLPVGWKLIVDGYVRNHVSFSDPNTNTEVNNKYDEIMLLLKKVLIL